MKKHFIKPMGKQIRIHSHKPGKINNFPPGIYTRHDEDAIQFSRDGLLITIERGEYYRYNACFNAAFIRLNAEWENVE